MNRLRPPLLAGLLLLALPASAQDLAADLDAAVQAYHDARQFNGAVLVAQGDAVFFAKGYGDANMEWDVPNTPDTRFRIGSVTKQFTAALILQLVEEGKLALDAPIATYLPDYPTAQADRVTVHHLLNHTSGIPSYTSLPDFLAFTRDPFEPDSLLALVWERDLAFEPGTQWSYSNSGYFLLGVLIETVTGKPYDQVLRERLLDPLGLADTGYEHNDAVIERRADGYNRTPRGYERAPYLDTSVPYAAGMMYATVHDLHRWTRALHAGQPFQKAETLAKMTTPSLQNYGYGVAITDMTFGETTARAIQHSGGIFGFNSQLWYFPEEAYTIVALDNAGGQSGAAAGALAHVLFGEPVPEPTESIADVLAPIIDAEGVEAAVARYHTLKENRPDAYRFAEPELNRLGYAYLNDGEVETAVRIFQLNVEAYPDAFNTYDSLGEAYLAAGDREQAIANYKKALELNPASTSAKAALERLGVEIEHEAITVPTAVLDTYVGRYEIQPGFVLTITRAGDQLQGEATGQEAVAMQPISQTAFFVPAANAQVTFHHNEAGEVDRLTLRQGGQDMPAPKIE